LRGLLVELVEFVGRRQQCRRELPRRGRDEPFTLNQPVKRDTTGDGAKRRAVDMLMTTLSMSERLACTTVGLARSTTGGCRCRRPL